MNIEKYISPFIESQFPLFYQEEGQLFIQFVTAYYEWLESNENILNQSRSLLNYDDVDKTLPKYLKYFKNKYINSLPENVLSDKKLLIKHILDLYRSKGTDASYRLLFRIIFNEDIDIYKPGEFIFKLSDNDWVAPRYIEVSDSPYLENLIGTKIYSSSTLSTATVENFFSTSANQKLVNVLLLSNLVGNFKFGEKIYSEHVPEITDANAPFVLGSLTTIGITNGGLNYKLGDELEVISDSDGSYGLVSVSSTRNKNGEVVFELIDGGSGYSMDAVISVDGSAFPIVNITNTNPVIVTTATENALRNENVLRIDFVEGMQQINNGNYIYYANVINSTSFEVYNNQALTNPLNGTTFAPYFKGGFVYINTGGTGASFEIGSLINKEIYNINTDTINDYVGTDLESSVSGFVLSVSNINGTFVANNKVRMANVNVREIDCIVTSPTILNVGENLSNTSLGINNLTVLLSDGSNILIKGSDLNNANLVANTVLRSNTTNTSLTLLNLYPTKIANATANVVFSNSTTITVNTQQGYFFVGETVFNQNSVSNAVVTGVKRNDDWSFPAINVPDDENLSSPIQNVLTYIQKEIGTIASLTNINPGDGYAINPVVTIVEPLIYDMRLDDGKETGTFKGFNAIVEAEATFGKGIVTSIKMIDSGYGYTRDKNVNLKSKTNPFSVSGKTVVYGTGIQKGYWKNKKSFLSDEMKLFDSDFYQNYSYQISVNKMKEVYEKHVKDFVHPVGMKMFGKFLIKSEFEDLGGLVETVSRSVKTNKYNSSDFASITSDSTFDTSDNLTLRYWLVDNTTLTSDNVGVLSDQINN